MTVDEAIQLLYASEINAEVNWFWDAGFTVRVGDRLNGFKTAVVGVPFEHLADTLVCEAIKYYPNSDLAKRAT